MVVEKIKESKIILLKDSREPKEKYNFFHYKDVFHIGGHPLIDNLNVGDYSLSSFENQLMIERKTEADIVSSFIGGKKDAPLSRRKEFKAMWERTTQKFRYLMIEGKFINLIEQNYRSAFHPHSLLGSLMSWSIRYNFSFFFVDNEVEGMKAIYWLCKEFLRLKSKGEI